MRAEAVALNSPSLVRGWLALQFSGLEREMFGVLFVDAQNRLSCGSDSHPGAEASPSNRRHPGSGSFHRSWVGSPLVRRTWASVVAPEGAESPLPVFRFSSSAGTRRIPRTRLASASTGVPDLIWPSRTASVFPGLALLHSAALRSHFHPGDRHSPTQVRSPEGARAPARQDRS